MELVSNFYDVLTFITVVDSAKSGKFTSN